MNDDLETIKSVLSELRSDYIRLTTQNIIQQTAPITERDIVAEIYCRLKNTFCNRKDLGVHCEIKPARSENEKTETLKRLPRIDVGILSNRNGRNWMEPAMKIEDKYKKGSIRARFLSVPLEFFHTAIEVKIQSDVHDAKEDIDILKKLNDSNEKCNCFFVLLNARGRKKDHEKIKKYADDKGICIFEYTCNL